MSSTTDFVRIAPAHTASHVLFGAGRRLWEGLGCVGFDIGTETVRVDLTTPTDVDDNVPVWHERPTNRAVWKSRTVTWGEQPAAKARSLKRVAFNKATEAGAFATGGAIRIVHRRLRRSRLRRDPRPLNGRIRARCGCRVVAP